MTCSKRASLIRSASCEFGGRPADSIVACAVMAKGMIARSLPPNRLYGEPWTRLWEDRGTELILPLEIKEVPNYKGPLTWLQTVNYIGHLDNGQATYDDCRFVEILTVKTRGEERKT
jgi:hypothetical protein